MNPYSARFDPGKYFAYTRKRAHTTCLIIAEDNEAVIKIIAKARSMALRHLPRTHRIDVHWLFEVCSHPRVRMLYVNTKQQIADLMTKALNNPATWEHLLDIAQIRAGVTSEKPTQHELSAAMLLTSPPGLSMRIQDAECPGCSFRLNSHGHCACAWN